ncbi:hypothetical protein GF360_03535 [candidate division WWE3 bacterium]|nr:hypothetical protein [candidate division WWE3 bacterium]
MTKVKSAHNLIVGLFLLAFILSLQVSKPSEAKSTIAKGKEEKRIEKTHEITFTTVNRVEVLKKFLEKYNSPLAEEAETFVRVADEKNLDYRLLPAISCMESTCGKFTPQGSYNAWGWGIYGTNMITFNSWEEAIETVGEGIAKNYAANGLNTPEEMAPVYTPPNSVNWSNGVRFFMNQMDEIALDS